MDDDDGRKCPHPLFLDPFLTGTLTPSSFWNHDADKWGTKVQTVVLSELACTENAGSDKSRLVPPGGDPNKVCGAANTRTGGGVFPNFATT
jgi:hypothetical protein